MEAEQQAISKMEAQRARTVWKDKGDGGGLWSGESGVQRGYGSGRGHKLASFCQQGRLGCAGSREDGARGCMANSSMLRAGESSRPLSDDRVLTVQGTVPARSDGCSESKSKAC